MFRLDGSTNFTKSRFSNSMQILMKKVPKILPSFIKNRVKNVSEKQHSFFIEPVLARNWKRDFIEEMSAQVVVIENERRQEKAR